MAACDGNTNAMAVIQFLHCLVELFIEYFVELEQESIRDNFVLIYELLDEVCDFGYPQFTNFKILQEYICIEEKHKLLLGFDNNKSKDITTLVTGIQHQRKSGIKYRKNEVFLDVIEKLTLLLKPNGQVIRSEIHGQLNMKTFLSGIPELKLGLNDKIMMSKKKRKKTSKVVEMDDIKFHDCVSLNKFDSDRIISFIPPDGEFILMEYRLQIPVKPVILFECHKEIMKNSRIEYTIKLCLPQWLTLRFYLSI